MRKILIGCLAFALLPAAAPAFAETAGAAQTNAQAQSARQRPARDAAPDPDRQICISERLSGSRMPRRVCRTAREWELLQNDGSDER